MTISSRPALQERRHSRPLIRLKRKHVLMLALAIEVLAFGVSHANRYQRPGILVDQPVTAGHTIV